MRKILIVLLSIPIITFSQKVKTIAELESFFREISHQGLIYDKQEFSYQNLNRLIDSLLPTVFDKPYPNQYNIYYWPYYPYNLPFKDLITTIDSIPITEETFNSPIGIKIKDRIQQLPHQALRAYAATHLVKRIFAESRDSSVIEASTDFLTIIDVNANDHFTLIQVAEKLTALASVHECVDKAQNALEVYLAAKRIADSINNPILMARIEERIGNLYLRRELDVYRRKAADHFIEASNLYLKGRDYTNCSISRLIGNRLRFQQPYGPSLLESVYKGKSREGYAGFIDSLWDNKYDNAALYLLNTTYHAFIDRNNRGNYYTYQIYMSLVQYFEAINEYETARRYTIWALLSIIDSWENSEISDFISGLRHLSYQCLMLKLDDKALNYYDTAIEISTWLGQDLMTMETNLQKANFLCIADQCTEGLSLAKEQFSLIEKIPYQDRKYAYTAISETIFRIYDRLLGDSTNWITIDSIKKKSPFYDSARIYYHEYKSDQADYIDEYELMANNEMDYQTDRLDNKVRDINKLLSATNLLLSSAQTEVRQRKRDLQILNDTLAVKNQDFLEKLKSISLLNQKVGELDTVISNREIHITKIDKELAEKISENKKINVGKNIAQGIAFIALAIGMFFETRSRRRKENLRNTREKADADAGNYIHNLKDDYEEFPEYIESGNLEDANEYANRCSAYLGLLHQKTYLRNTAWTISQEESIMKAFYNFKQLVYGEINIIRDYRNVNPDKVQFLPDVFCTLLHNSLKAKDPSKNSYFKISMLLQSQVLYCSFDDNGIPSDIEDYIEPGQNHGLGYIKTRIEATAKLNRRTRKIDKPFEIISKPGEGTTIKFIYPYAEIKNSYR
jgi:hypothetical protein